ncbi:hypothetical protein MTO96_008317 [Rhipicephalus appendiculatus]
MHGSAARDSFWREPRPGSNRSFSRSMSRVPQPNALSSPPYSGTQLEEPVLTNTLVGQPSGRPGEGWPEHLERRRSKGWKTGGREKSGHGTRPIYRLAGWPVAAKMLLLADG